MYKNIFFIIFYLLIILSTDVGFTTFDEDEAEKEKKTEQLTSILQRYEEDLKKNPNNLKLIEALADAYYSLQIYDKAVEYYGRAFALEPRNRSLELQLAFAYLGAKNYKKSFELLQDLQKVEPKNPSVIGGLGRVEAQQHHIIEAEKYYQQALQIDPDHALTLFYLGELKTSQKKYGEAEDLFKKVLQIDPKAIWAKQALKKAELGPILDEINGLEEKGELTSALKRYQKELSENPNNVDLNVGLARLYTRMKQYSEAIKLLNSAIKQNLKDAQLGRSLGFVYLARGDINQAHLIFEQLQEEEPKDAETLAGLGRIEAVKGNVHEAEALYKKALEADPNDTLSLSFLGKLKMDQKNYKEAKKIYEKILEINPNALWAKQTLMDIRLAPLYDSIKRALQLGDYSQAENLYRKLIMEEPNHVDNYIRFAQLYMKQKKYLNAIEIYMNGLELNPTSKELNLALAYAYLKNGQMEESQNAYNIVLKQMTSNPEALAGMGRTYALMGDEESALNWYLKALESDPHNVIALGYLADLAMAKKNYAYAEQVYKLLLRIEPNASWAKQSLYRAKYAPQFAEIKDLENSGNTPGAIAAYKNLLKTVPESVDLYLGLGQIYLNQKRSNEALDLFKEGLYRNPDNNQLRVDMGLAYLDLGKLTQAQRIFLKALNKDSQNAEAMAGLGKIDEKIGDDNAAEYWYYLAFKSDPENLFVLSTLAQFALTHKEFLEAQEYYSDILQLDPTAKWAKQGYEQAKFAPYLQQIEEKIKHREFQSVEDLYKKLIEMSPDNPDNYVKLGQFYIKSKRYQDAVITLLQGLSKQPDSSELQIGLGYAYLRKGDVQIAEDVFNRVIKKNPSDAEAIAALGQVAETRGHFNEAESFYKRALRVQPDNITALIYLADLNQHEGKYPAAMKLYNKIYHMDPTASWLKLAIKDAKYGPIIAEIKKNEAADNYLGAEEAYKQLLLLAPRVKEYYLRFGLFYHHNKQYQKAIDIYLKGITLSPKYTELYAALGLTYLSKKNTKAASKAFHKALKLDPTNADALAGLGSVAILNKKFDIANKYILASIASDPNGIAGLSSLGNLRMAEKRYGEAEKAYKRLMELLPKEKWVRLLYEDSINGYEVDRLDLLAKDEHYSEAAAGYRALIAKYPGNPRYYFGLGLMYLRLKEYSNAAETYAEGLRTSPEEDELLVSLGYAYMFNKELGMARQVLIEALKKDNKNAETLAGLGHISALEENNCEAEYYFLRALEISPINQSALSFYGDFLMKQKRYKEAKDLFVRLHELIPKAVWLDRVIQDAEDGPMMDLALEFANNEDFECAEEVYRELIDLSPEDPARYQPLGQILIDLEEYNEAICVFQQGLEIDPEASYLWRGIAYTYIELSDFDSAACIFLYLLSIDENDGKSWAGLGRIQALHGSECLAEEYYSYSLAIDPQDATTLSFLADLRKEQHFYFSGLELYMTLMSIDPKPKWVRTGYNTFLNLTCPTIAGAGSYHAEYQWDPQRNRWQAEYLVYGGSIQVSYPVCDDLYLWGRVADQIYALNDLENHLSIYSFDVQRLYIGEEWVYSPCSYIDAKIGLSNFSGYKCSTFKMQRGLIAEPSIIFTFHRPIEKWTLGFSSDADLIARDFSTNRAKLVGRYFLIGTYERELYTRTWGGLEASTYWYNDYVGNTSQRASGWLQWRPPVYFNNILFRYYVKYQTFAHNIPDYYTYKPQIINQLQVTLQKYWRVCWADSLYTSLSYSHGWQDTHTRFPQIIVIVPGSTLPQFVWDRRQFDTLVGNILYKYDQIQVGLNADFYRDTEKYTMFTVVGEVTWRF